MFKPMSRVILSALALVLAFGISFAQAEETPPQTLLAVHAHLVPENALLYATARTDDASIRAVDKLIADITDGIPNAEIPPIETLLTRIGLPIDQIRPWLGDHIGLVIHPQPAGQYVSHDSFGYVLLDTTDIEGARAFFRSIKPDIVMEAYGDILRVNGRTEPFAYSLDSVPTFADSPAYRELSSSLQGPDYIAAAYVDPVTILNYIGIPRGTFLPAFGLMGRILGPIVLGITRAADDMLYIDTAFSAPNLTGLDMVGLRFAPATVSTDILAHVPHGAIGVITGHDLLGLPITLWHEMIPQILSALSQPSSQRPYGKTNLDTITSLIDSAGTEGVADFAIGGLLGITLADLHNLLSGDYAIFSFPNPDYKFLRPYSSPLAANMGIIFTVDDAARAAESFDVLARTLTVIQHGAFSITPDILTTRAEDYRRLDLGIYNNTREPASLRLSLAVTGDSVIFGTTKAVDSALAQRGGAIAPWLTDAMQYFHPNAILNSASIPSAQVSELERWRSDAIHSYEIEALQTMEGFLGNLDLIVFSIGQTPTGGLTSRYSIRLNGPETAETTAQQPPAQPNQPPQPEATVMRSPTSVSLPTQATETLGYDFSSWRTEDGAFRMGTPDAPVTIVVFSDWACPHCQVFDDTLEQLIDVHMPEGTFNVEHRTLATAGGETTVKNATIAECVDILSTGTFWEARRLLYDLAVSYPLLYKSTADTVRMMTSSFGIDPNLLIDCYYNLSEPQIERDMAYARTVGANYTPYVMLITDGGERVQLRETTVDGLIAAIRAASAR